MAQTVDAIYKQKSTTLESSNVKLSGKYKIVIASTGALFLDDYLGNRQEINIYADFLPQVSNFLQNKTQIVDADVLNYGFSMHNNKLKFHVPLYLNEKIPNYMVVNILSELADVDDFNKHKNIKIQSLSVINNIFDEILNDNFKHLFYNNFNENYIELYGWSLIHNTKTSLKIDTHEYQTKLTDTDEYHNYISELFFINDMINPRFINIELEMDYSVNNFIPVTFYGFVGISETITGTPDGFTDSIVINSRNNKQLFYYENDDRELNYPNLVYQTNNMQVVIPTERYIELKFNNFNINDTLSFKYTNPVGDVITDFEYVIQPEDRKSTINLTLQALKVKFNEISDYRVEHNNDKLVLFQQSIHDLVFDGPTYITTNTTNKHFIIKDTTDVKLNVYIPIDEIEIYIDDVKYPVTAYYNEYGYHYYKLDTTDKNIDFSDVFLKVNQYIDSVYYKVGPMENSKYAVNIKYFENSNKLKYVEWLQSLTDNELVLDNLIEFKNSILNYVEPIPFIGPDYLSKNNIQLMGHSTISGSSTYCLPYVYNHDRQFFIENAIKLLYHWFLVNAECPPYLDSVARERFVPNFDGTLNNVKLKSILKKKNKEDTFCECVFLGAKYKLPHKYDGYEFAVIHMPNDNIKDEADQRYDMIVNDEDKQIIVTLHKFMLFVDLIRNGNIDNLPMIDLSLYYNVDKIYTSNEDDIQLISKKSGLLIADEDIPVLFKDSSDLIKDNWIYDDKYICLKNNHNVSAIDLQSIIPTEGDVEFYHYNKVQTSADGEVSFIAVRYLIKNIQDLTRDYVWCEDLHVSFFETDKFYVNFNDVDSIDFIKVDSIDNSSVVDGTNMMVEAVINGTTTRTFIDHTKTLSFKEDFYMSTSHDLLNVYKFIENTTDVSVLQQKIINSVPYNDKFSDLYAGEKINLFHRNQLWHIVRELLTGNVYFKHTSFDEVRKSIKDLTLERLRLYAELNLVGGVKMRVETLDVGLVLWDTQINRITRNSALFTSNFTEQKLSTSKVMCYIKDVIVNTKGKLTINYLDLLKTKLDLDDENTINLLSKYYAIDSVLYLGEKIDFGFSKNKKYTITIKDRYTNKDLEIIFKRK